MQVDQAVARRIKITSTITVSTSPQSRHLSRKNLTRDTRLLSGGTDRCPLSSLLKTFLVKERPQSFKRKFGSISSRLDSTMLARLRTPRLTRDRRSAFSLREGSKRRKRVNPGSETRLKGRRIPKGSQAGRAQEECASSRPHHSQGAPTRTHLTSGREAIRWERCRRPLSLLR